MARHVAPTAVHLEDYTPPAYLVEKVDLRFRLDATRTRVVSRMQLSRNPKGPGGDLVLDGKDLELIRVLKNGRKLGDGDFTLGEDRLVIPDPGARLELEVETQIAPARNTSLEGLYLSAGNFCTQCEAEGFRKITFYPDRPDVLARFTTTIEADAAAYPVLLSNGNPVESGKLENGRHWTRWEDPFPKPSYLFALVAGDLAVVRDHFTTRSGRRVSLAIYVQQHNLDKCAHAMRSLKSAMRWDEQRFGREYDLDHYMIVAVDDFNMGAMENKGLNIFNSKFVLARPDTATDKDFIDIESVVAHEYFHNWTGNRITCRDWFQLTLKEGLTVYRDQEFTADLNSRALKRIEDVDVLRSRQFAEDAGPMAHAIQPDSYVEINNFYTATVYNKGAEVIRMISTLLGDKGFRRGMDLYFASHDGEAATTEDFLRAMEDATGCRLEQFRRWYHQAGTPRLAVSTRYEAAEKCLHVTLRQSCPPTPGQPDKQPFHMPVRIGLLDADGGELPLRLDSERRAAGCSRVLELKESEKTFRFAGIEREPVVSVLRDFSAPVTLDFEQSDEELGFLMAHDTDAFNRWDAGQRLAVRVVLARLDGDTEASAGAARRYIRGLEATLADDSLDEALAARALMLPSEGLLAGRMTVVDPDGIHEAREHLANEIAGTLHAALGRTYDRLGDAGARVAGGQAAARRSLRNACLACLARTGQDGARLAAEQFDQASNMTDMMAALRALVFTGAAEAEAALAAFARRWAGEPLVMDKWFALQAAAPLASTVDTVAALLEHSLFDLRNPNRARAVLASFGELNPYAFHQQGGRGYRMLADQIIRLDALNPSTAARIVAPLTRWQRYDSSRQAAMKTELERIAALDSLSRNLYEQVRRSLDEAEG